MVDAPDSMAVRHWTRVALPSDASETLAETPDHILGAQVVAQGLQAGMRINPHQVDLGDGGEIREMLAGERLGICLLYTSRCV